MTETPTYLKVLAPTNTACHGGTFDYTAFLPAGDEPGAPLPERTPVLCKSGWHWCNPDSLMRRWAKPHMQVFEAAPSEDVSPFDEAGKCVSASGRLLRPYPLPDWWQATMAFVGAIPDVPWFAQSAEPRPEWKLFTASTLATAWAAARATARDAARAAARDAARGAARDAAWDAAWAAAWDARLAASYEFCADLPIEQSHRDHVIARWDVWQRGYGLLGDVGGVLYVYGVTR